MKRKDSGNTSHTTKSRLGQKRPKSSKKEVLQSSSSEDRGDSSPTHKESGHSYIVLPIKHDFAPQDTLKNITGKMKCVFSDLKKMKKVLHERKNTDGILQLLDTVYGPNIESIYGQDNFELNDLVKNDDISDITKKADILLKELERTGNRAQTYKDLHMRKAPATCMGFIDDAEEKISMYKVIEMYSELYKSTSLPSVMELYNIINPMIVSQETDKNETFFISLGYELILLLQVLIYPYVYHHLRKWPSCEGLELDEVEESRVLFNTEHLVKGFSLVDIYFKLFSGGKKRSDIKYYEKGMKALADIKYHRIVIGLLCGMIRPTEGVRNNCLRFMAVFSVISDHDNAYKKKVQGVSLPALSDEEKKHFVTKLERQHLLEFKRQNVCSNGLPNHGLPNFIDEIKKMLSSLDTGDN